MVVVVTFAGTVPLLRGRLLHDRGNQLFHYQSCLDVHLIFRATEPHRFTKILNKECGTLMSTPSHSLKCLYLPLTIPRPWQTLEFSRVTTPFRTPITRSTNPPTPPSPRLRRSHSSEPPMPIYTDKARRASAPPPYTARIVIPPNHAVPG